MMKKSYSQFKPDDIKNLGLSFIRGKIFNSIKRLEPSQFLLDTLAINQEFPIESEKAKSEYLIVPILTEIQVKNPKKFTCFSGYQFNVDSQLGLKGFCDFIISKKYNAVFIESPLVAVVEVKSNQDLPDASPQCIAEMYAAQLYNEKNEEKITAIYGSITNGYEWIFLRLENKEVILDIHRYGIKNLSELLGVWQVVIDSFDGVK
ncbi:MAG: hypothetical protein Q9M50_09525 [Methylococcales bacterium]|nr:hypothetical protein [Methylococcales bacterium]